MYMKQIDNEKIIAEKARKAAAKIAAAQLAACRQDAATAARDAAATLGLTTKELKECTAGAPEF